MTINEINDHIARLPNGESGNISDGYHSFSDLYAHRIHLFVALLSVSGRGWRSKKHSDGSSFDGWFIAGIGQTPGEQITYHLPDSYWEKTNFLHTLDNAPDWDGHTSDDVLKRIEKLFF